MHDLSLRSSGEPNISCAVRPSTLTAASQHSSSRGPRIGCRKFASASALLLIEYRLDIELCPRPSNCGKMYHIQCERFRPLRISVSSAIRQESSTRTKKPRLRTALAEFLPESVKTCPASRG